MSRVVMRSTGVDCTKIHSSVAIVHAEINFKPQQMVSEGERFHVPQVVPGPSLGLRGVGRRVLQSFPASRGDESAP